MKSRLRSRSLLPAVIVAAAILAPGRVSGASAVSIPDLTVGRNLQTYASVRLSEPAPPAGLQLTVTSGDPRRLLLSTAPDRAGAAIITLTVKPRLILSPEFWVHGLADTGDVTYTVTAPEIVSAKGTVKLGPSAILILGPFRLPSFPTTPRAQPAKVTVFSALLDASLKVIEEQQVAGGLTVEVGINNSNPATGVVGAPKLTIAGGSSEVSTYFKPAAEGSAILSLAQPTGFTTPAEYEKVTAMVERPGLAISDEVTIGKNLQMLGVLCLGEAAPDGGLEVTLVSSDPGKLVLSTKEHEVGSGTLTITVPPGQLTATYYLQALGDSGTLTYRATAKGFRRRIAQIGLAPSGFIVAFERYGPPDKAAVLRPGSAEEDERRFFASLAAAAKEPVHLAVYSVQIDPSTGMAADITVQPLRAGISAQVTLKSSNPGIATVESPLTIAAGTNRVRSRFTPLSTGETVITINTPPGFLTPKNATVVPATVMP